MLNRSDFRRFEKSEIEQSIPARFARQVSAHPDRLAVRSVGPEDLSYRQLDEQSNQIAHHILAARGLKSEAIALLLDQGATSVRGILGILKAGKFYVALEPSLPTPELRRIAADCAPGLVLTDSKNLSAASNIGLGKRRCINLDALDPDTPKSAVDISVSPDSLAYVFYTSGSTGAPKGVCDNHRNVLHNVMRYTNSLQIGSGDRLSLIQSCAFSGTVSTLFAALLNGASVYPFDLRSEGIARLAEWIAHEKLTIFHAVPVLFEQLLETQREFHHLRLIRLEGDCAYLRHVSAFRSRLGANCVLVNGLGTTETGIIRQYFVTHRTQIQSGMVPVGHAVEEMDILLLDEAGNTVPEGTAGEVAVRSRYLAVGYWNNPDLTARSFLADQASPGCRVYRTGDIARMLPGGCLQYLHRKDFVDKIRGQRIEIAHIEEALNALPTVQQAVVSVREDRPGHQQLVAYVVPSGARPPTVSALRKALSLSLPQVMLPGRYVFIDNLPLDTNRKVLRRGLPAPDGKRPPLASGFVAARSRRQKVIASCFEQVLGVRPVGLYDDFFELGGDSLQATELILSLENRLRTACPHEFPFETSTVAGLDELLRTGHAAHRVATLQSRGNAVPLFVMHGTHLYQKLAVLLAPDHPVIAIRRTNFFDQLGPNTSLEDLASGYVREIRRLQVTGPYQLCGNCFDGVVAFEAARQLRAAGQDVAFLGLIDTEFPIGPPKADQAGARAVLAAARMRYRQARVGLHRRLLPLAPQSIYLRGLLGRQFRRNLAAYRPRPYDGEAILFCIGEVHNQRGWETVVEGGLKIVELPLYADIRFDRLPHLIGPPYVELLAAEIRKLLATERPALSGSDVNIPRSSELPTSDGLRGPNQLSQ